MVCGIVGCFAWLGRGARRAARRPACPNLRDARLHLRSAGAERVGHVQAPAFDPGAAAGRPRFDDPGQCARASSINQRVISMEATEPVARSSGGVVGTLAPYLRSHVTPSLVRRGQSNYSDHYAALRSLEVRYGVDPAILMAIWGHETSYGTVTGSTDLLQALASLGYYGRRRDFFEGEFIAALKLMDQGVPRWRLKGSWAGATGYPQFMPSVALRLRADGDGDGYADIWANELDGLASIAMYLRDAGWKPNIAWGIAGAHPGQPQPRRDRQSRDRAALPAGVSPPQPVAEHARMARDGRHADRPHACRQ